MTREQALAAVRRWLEQISSSQDVASSLQPTALEDAGRLAGFLGGKLEDLEILLALGWMHWYWHLALDSDDDLHKAVRAFTPCFLADAGPFPEPVMPLLADAAAAGAAMPLVARAAVSTDPDEVAGIVARWRRILARTPASSPDRPGRLSCLGNVLRFSFQLSARPAELDESIACHQEAVATCPADHPDRAAILDNLALALHARIIRSATRADLDEAIASLTEAVAIRHPGDPRRRKSLSDLGANLHVRSVRFGNPADLEQAVSAGREAVSGLPADHRDRGTILGNLAATLHTRFERSGAAADLEEAIGLYRAGLESMPSGDPNLAAMSSSLGAVLHDWFELTGDISGLDEAVAVSREAVSLTAAGDDALPHRQHRLRVVLQDRFYGTGRLADLDEAITLYRAAIASLGPDDPLRPVSLCNLGNALRIRFDRKGEPADLDEAITLHRAALAAVPPADPERAVNLAALATSLRSRFGQLGREEDLEESIARLREAVAIAPASDHRRPKHLTNLGVTLRDRFGRTAVEADLDEAIALLREAAAAGPAGHPQIALYLNNLGAALQTRYSRTGSTEDLDEAVTVGRQALSAIPPGHPQRAWYQSNLGAILQIRYHRAGSARDLDEAITLQRAAAADTAAGLVDTARYRYNLAVAVLARYQRAGSPEDLDEAIALGRAAIAATPADRIERTQQLNNLGDALWKRFDRTGSPGDLDEAIAVLRDAVAAAPPGQPGRAAALSNLGVALRSRFRQPGGDPADLDEAIETLAEAAHTAQARPSERIRAARSAAALLTDRDVHRAAGLLEMAVQLLPEVAPRELTSRDKQYQLGVDLELGAGLAADAAALALADDSAGHAGPPRALGLLELGRAVLLTQSLETRSDVSDLQAREPSLARRFGELRDALDHAQADPGAPLAGDGTAAGPPGQQADRDDQVRRNLVRGDLVRGDLRQLAADFRDVLRRIRAIPGFDGFLRPPSAGQLTGHASAGAIAVLNVSQYRSDAILVRPEGITGIPLPGLEREVLAGKITAFYQFLGQANSAAATGEQRQAAQRSVTGTLEWLWDVAAEPVLSALGYREAPAAGVAWPQLWWAPGGLLGTLPIHAAGYHRPGPAGPPGATVMDRVVSSYTPTVRTLAYARERTAQVGAVPALVVAMPVTPGLTPLKFAAQEVVYVREHIPQADIYIEDQAGVTDRTPTRERVLTLMARCAVAHFACHGSNDPQDPSRSQLYLHDHADKPLTVAALSAIRLERAQLAYLSACGTALNRNQRLLDEAIHLTAAFQLTGFARVIGTLWPIDDMISASIADSFYSGLQAGDGSIDISRAAAALHRAQRIARDALTAFPSLWAPYIHMGA